MRPIVHGLEAEYWGEIDFVYLDHLDPVNEEMLESYNFRWRPLYVLIEPDGTEIQRWFGFVPETELRAALDSVLDES
jgi:hypothetical protein